MTKAFKIFAEDSLGQALIAWIILAMLTLSASAFAAAPSAKIKYRLEIMGISRTG